MTGFDGTALLVLTSNGVLGDTGRPTGAYAAEVAESWQVFASAGFRVEVASIQGGRPPLEAVDTTDPAQQAFFADDAMTAAMAATRPVCEVDPTAYGIVFTAGGHGAVWDLPYDEDLAALLRDAYEHDAVIAAVCHGPAALLGARLSNGEYLVAGRKVACFTNDEERAVGMTSVVPFLLADELVKRGAKHHAVGPFLPHVVVDGRLVTGQNPASTELVAKQAVAVATATGDRCR
ncbi:type 1 glutamine amidotransferase domain-containing protein [Kribbella sp. NPDC050470]|uniref:type 1 glutamine amidotransferase domain-containing protein n=1 Tax=unclassified Kribbella TaxID=2644121 RepID=UPI0037889668